MRAFEQRKKNTSNNSSFFSPKIQKKLKTGTPGDHFEVEADKVADKVVNNNSSGGLLQSKSEEEVQQNPISETISSVQSKEMKEEEPVQKKSDEKEEKVQKKTEEKEEPVQKKEEKKEEEPVQKKAEEKEEAVQKKTEEKEEPVQKKEEKKEEEPVQKKAEEKEEAVQKKAEEKEEPVQKKTEEKEEVAQAKCAECEKEEKAQKKSNPSMVETNLKKGKGNPLDKKVKAEMENSFGVDFSSIRIHTDSNAINMCQEMKAQAFTNGVNIYFNKGKYNPDSSEGKKLLAHELTHTVQQGAVKQKSKKEK
ncbi:MAG: DUF4157 domain-containing protein [Flavobacteriales bacterium]|nr:DUF4157 domain-containing protein [Flavobacteriales bacterium]